MSGELNPIAPAHLPGFISAPGEGDTLMVLIVVLLIVIVLLIGHFFFWLHSLPERMAHRANKVQFEIVAVLALLSLFTHNNIFWVSGLLLALIQIPDFSTPVRSMARSLHRIAGHPGSRRAKAPAEDRPLPPEADPAPAGKEV